MTEYVMNADIFFDAESDEEAGQIRIKLADVLYEVDEVSAVNTDRPEEL